MTLRSLNENWPWFTGVAGDKTLFWTSSWQGQKIWLVLPTECCSWRRNIYADFQSIFLYLKNFTCSIVTIVEHLQLVTNSKTNSTNALLRFLGYHHSLWTFRDISTHYTYTCLIACVHRNKALCSPWSSTVVLLFEYCFSHISYCHFKCH